MFEEFLFQCAGDMPGDEPEVEYAGRCVWRLARGVEYAHWACVRLSSTVTKHRLISLKGTHFL